MSLKVRTFEDYGIIPGQWEKCPRCESYQLQVDQKAGTWVCYNERCRWTGALGQNLVSGYRNLWEAASGLDTWYRLGPPRGEKTGWPEMDRYYTVRRGEWTLVTGIPSHGKSEWLDSLMVNLMRKGWKFGMYSPENMPYEDHVSKLVEKVIGKGFHDVYREGTLRGEKMHRKEMEVACSWLASRIFFIEPGEITMEALLVQVKQLIKDQRITGFILDPWNEVEHNIPPGMREDQYLSRVLALVGRFAKTQHVHVWIVAHPTKLAKNKDGSYPIPTPYDVSGGAHWRNKCDNALCVWRDPADGTDQTTVHIQKVRKRVVGIVGQVKFDYDYISRCYKATEQQNDNWEFPIEDIKRKFKFAEDPGTWPKVHYWPNEKEIPNTQTALSWEHTGTQWTTALDGFQAEVLDNAGNFFAFVGYGERSWAEEFTDKKISAAKRLEEALAWCERKILEEQVHPTGGQHE